MANKFFRFKQFTVFQNDEVLKVSTDSVLLGAWVIPENYKTILDIGTGTGLLALMVAQRFPHAMVDAVEIDTEACQFAGKNIGKSTFSKRINLFPVSIQKFAEDFPENRYDLIISNPPYFKNQKPAATEKKNIQKHSRYLSPDELAAISKMLLSEDGIIALVFPMEEGRNFIATARFHGLFCSRITEVFVCPSQKSPKRLLFLFSKKKRKTVFEKLFLKDNSGKPSKEYISLTKMFYLYF